MNDQGQSKIVIDTHVVLEALLFGDSRASALRAGVERGRWCWVATEAMRDEFERVLRRPSLRRWNPDAEALRLAFGALATFVEPAAPAALRCCDADDQIFVDLALAQRAGWLLSRDRALLALRHAAARHGVAIAPPEALPATRGGRIPLGVDASETKR
jgi:putative PIN family toxin of toxin-antitoxin system